jgi:hypothetical protein
MEDRQDRGRGVDRRTFLKSSLLKTGAGLLALNELLSSELLARGTYFVIEPIVPYGPPLCKVEPESVIGSNPESWKLTFQSGRKGLPLGCALVIRCMSGIEPEHNLTVTSSWPLFDPDVQIKQNIGQDRVIWIEPGSAALPPFEKIIITLDEYVANMPRQTVTECAFSVVEMDPDGKHPEIGSGLTFTELPVKGGTILPGPTDRFNVVLPTIVKLGHPLSIKISALDKLSFGTPDFAGIVSLSADKAVDGLPDTLEFLPQDRGSKKIEVTPLESGVIRIRLAMGDITADSNPCICTTDPMEENIYWGDYHKHSFHCDGHQRPGEIYDYARSFAFLDFGMLTSHDMLPFPKRGSRNWEAIWEATESMHEPGEFITFQAYEWTHNNPFSPDDARGHKVVIFKHPEHLLPLLPFTYGNGGERIEFMPPTTLLDLLKKRSGKDVMVIPHHLPLYKWWVFPEVELGEMGGPLPAMTREEIDAMQPVAEVFSKVHGYNESYELMNWIQPPTTFGGSVYFTFWQDALKAGVRAGAVCAGDNHYLPMGHPRDTGLTAVKAESLTREAIFDAIVRRHTYGTSGLRIFIDFTIDGAVMGDIIPLKPGSPPTLESVVAAPVPIDYIEVVKVTPGKAEVCHEHDAAGEKETLFTWLDFNHDPNRWACYYLRVHLNADEHGAWTSPIWLDPDLK